ncbi:hypothetical protein BC629DRAFT_1443845 [Irpex lacteus]|nr:hypothetical protein BC629DRAFT_1443845 [Irpex lacteus]
MQCISVPIWWPPNAFSLLRRLDEFPARVDVRRSEQASEATPVTESGPLCPTVSAHSGSIPDAFYSRHDHHVARPDGRQNARESAARAGVRRLRLPHQAARCPDTPFKLMLRSESYKVLSKYLILGRRVLAHSNLGRYRRATVLSKGTYGNAVRHRSHQRLFPQIELTIGSRYQSSNSWISGKVSLTLAATVLHSKRTLAQIDQWSLDCRASELQRVCHSSVDRKDQRMISVGQAARRMLPASSQRPRYSTILYDKRSANSLAIYIAVEQKSKYCDPGPALCAKRFVVEGHNIAIHCDSGGLVHDFLNVAYVHFIIHWYAFGVRVALYGKHATTPHTAQEPQLGNYFIYCESCGQPSDEGPPDVQNISVSLGSSITWDSEANAYMSFVKYQSSWNPLIFGKGLIGFILLLCAHYLTASTLNTMISSRPPLK